MSSEVFRAKLQKFYLQKEKYNFTDRKAINGVETDTKDFIQLVWKNYKSIGVGVSKSLKKPNTYYLVIAYSPPSNSNERRTNVSTPLSKFKK